MTWVDEQVAHVLSWLEAQPGWLLILDNVDTEDAAREAERLLAELRAGHVVITSRIGDWSGGVEALELDVLEEKDAMSFLLERTSRRRRAADDPAAAAAVARELGCLALGLEQAGAYIDRLRLSFADYLARWRDHRPKVPLARRAADGVPGERGDHLGDDLRPVAGAGAAAASGPSLAGARADPAVPPRRRAPLACPPRSPRGLAGLAAFSLTSSRRRATPSW